jgi:hypothetical protein
MMYFRERPDFPGPISWPTLVKISARSRRPPPSFEKFETHGLVGGPAKYVSTEHDWRDRQFAVSYPALLHRPLHSDFAHTLPSGGAL